MEINSQILEKLSQLSALKMTEEEKKEMQVFLTQVLSHFENIKKIDTKNISPLFSPLKPALSLREDKVIDFKQKNQLLAQSPKKEGNLVKAPLVL